MSDITSKSNPLLAFMNMIPLLRTRVAVKVESSTNFSSNIQIFDHHVFKPINKWSIKYTRKSVLYFETFIQD